MAPLDHTHLGALVIGEKAFIELLGAEKQLEAKKQKRDEVKAKKRAELEKQLEESKKDEEKGGEEAA